jgi:hypothetical protein
MLSYRFSFCATVVFGGGAFFAAFFATTFFCGCCCCAVWCCSSHADAARAPNIAASTAPVRISFLMTHLIRPTATGPADTLTRPRFPGYSLISSTVFFTDWKERSNIAFSSAVSSIFRIFSTPPEPITTGTPM